MTQCEKCGRHVRGRPDKDICDKCREKGDTKPKVVGYLKKDPAGRIHGHGPGKLNSEKNKKEDVKPLPEMTEKRRNKIAKKEKKYNKKYFSTYAKNQESKGDVKGENPFGDKHTSGDSHTFDSGNKEDTTNQKNNHG